MILVGRLLSVQHPLHSPYDGAADLIEAVSRSSVLYLGAVLVPVIFTLYLAVLW